MHAKSRRRVVVQPYPSGFTLLEGIVTVITIAILLALLIPAFYRDLRPIKNRTQCMNNLKHIGLALHNYESQYGAFPPAYTVDEQGKPLHSWRTLLLPFLDQQALYNRIDLSKPWDDPVNQAAGQTSLSVFSCPSANLKPGMTTYLVVVTPDSVLQPGVPRKTDEIKDGPSNTILVIEVAPEHAVPWMSPQDADLNLLLSYNAQTKDAHGGGRNILLGDGSVRFISNALNPETLKAMITVNGGEVVGEF